MYPSGTTLFTGLVVSIIASAVSEVCASDGRIEIDPRATLHRLVDRCDMLVRGEVEYRTIVTVADRTAIEAFESAVDVIPNASLDHLEREVRTLVSAGEAQQGSESWQSSIVFDRHASLWHLRRERVSGRESTMLREQAAVSGAIVQPSTTSESIWRSSDETVRIINGNVVVREQPRDGSALLVPLDVSLGPWQGGLANPANTPGQEVTSWGDAEGIHLMYLDVHDSGLVLATEYVFDARRDYAPLRVTMMRDGVVTRRMVFGYSDLQQPNRPSLTVEWKAAGDGRTLVFARHVDRWTDECDPAKFDLRLPRVHLALTKSSQVPGISSEWVLPPELAEVSPMERRKVALNEIIAAMPTRDPKGDFNGDGSVDADDIYYVLRELP